jgi:hypothetical protein
MAAEDHLATYRQFSDAELATEITLLGSQRQNHYSAQNVGAKGYQRDIRLIEDKFSAAVQIRGERAATNKSPFAAVDFSQVRIS